VIGPIPSVRSAKLSGVELGTEIGRGLRSVVYEFGDADIAKVPNPDVPVGWLVEELRLTQAAARAGASVPRRTRLVSLGGAAALAGERIHGPSMWDRLVEDASLAPGLAADLARVQFELARLPTSFELPAQRDRIVSKIHLAARQHGEELLRTLDVMPPDVGPLVLCHGDLHPRNVLLPSGGEVLVDWFDASRGLIEAEVARTLIMLEDSHEIGPGSEAVVERAIDDFRAAYLAAATTRVDRELVDQWMVVQGVARLAEGFGRHRLDVLRRRLAQVR
jgi:hypothetical protein